MNYPSHKMNFRAPLNYIDLGGVIYNGRYADIYNQARDEYMRSTGYSYLKMSQESLKHLVVTEINMKFRKPVFYDEEITIVSTVKKINSKGIIFNQKIFKDDMQSLCNEAEFKMACIDYSFKTAKIPDKTVKAFENGPSC